MTLRAPSIAAACFFLVGACKDDAAKQTTNPRVNPEHTIRVHAKKWLFEFEYENGVIDRDLHVPRGVPVALELTSLDVVHTLSIPDVAFSADAVPGRSTDVALTADREGWFDLTCTAACGMTVPMPARLVVQEPEAFEYWLVGAKAALEPVSPVELGRKVYEQKGCNACHSIDGSPKVGAPLDGVWGTTITLTDGSSVVVDEAFLRRALDDPGPNGRPNYPPSMPSYKGQITDEELAGLAAYLASLK